MSSSLTTRVLLVLFLLQVGINMYMWTPLSNPDNIVQHGSSEIPRHDSINVADDLLRHDSNTQDSAVQLRADLEKANSELEKQLDHSKLQIESLSQQLLVRNQELDDVRMQLSNVHDIPRNPAPILSAGSPAIQIVILTVPRKQATDYLLRTLQSLQASLHPVLNIQISVVNMRPSQHSVFDQAREEFSSNPLFSFVELDPNFTDTDQPGDLVVKPGLTPTDQARQQNRDLVRALRHVSDSITFRSMFIMEDDFTVCPLGLYSVSLALSKADTGYPEWNSIRFSFGMNGILLPSSDVPALADYLESQVWMMPVDLLTDEWLMNSIPKAKEYHGTRKSLFYKSNLLEHIGDVSSFDDGRGKRLGLQCGEAVRLVNSYVPDTQYHRNCASRGFDLSPCELLDPSVAKMTML